MITTEEKAPALYKTKDRNLVIMLMAKGAEVMTIESTNGFITFFFDRIEVQPTLEAWFGNKPIPMDDARQYIIATELFNSFVRGTDGFATHSFRR